MVFSVFGAFVAETVSERSAIARLDSLFCPVLGLSSQQMHNHAHGWKALTTWPTRVRPVEKRK